MYEFKVVYLTPVIFDVRFFNGIYLEEFSIFADGFYLHPLLGYLSCKYISFFKKQDNSELLPPLDVPIYILGSYLIKCFFSRQ